VSDADQNRKGLDNVVAQSAVVARNWKAMLPTNNGLVAGSNPPGPTRQSADCAAFLNYELPLNWRDFLFRMRSLRQAFSASGGHFGAGVSSARNPVPGRQLEMERPAVKIAKAGRAYGAVETIQPAHRADARRQSRVAAEYAGR